MRPEPEIRHQVTTGSTRFIRMIERARLKACLIQAFKGLNATRANNADLNWRSERLLCPRMTKWYDNGTSRTNGATISSHCRFRRTASSETDSAYYWLCRGNTIRQLLHNAITPFRGFELTADCWLTSQ
jgi:hypothetical protein